MEKRKEQKIKEAVPLVIAWVSGTPREGDPSSSVRSGIGLG